MKILIFAVTTVMCLRTASYGISEIRLRNLGGGVSVIILAIIAFMSGVTLIY